MKSEGADKKLHVAQYVEVLLCDTKRSLKKKKVLSQITG